MIKLPNFNKTSITLSLTRISKYEYDNNYEYAIFSRGFNLAIKKVIQMFGGKKKMELCFKCKDCVDANVCMDYMITSAIKLNNLIKKWEDKKAMLELDKRDPMTFACLAQLHECIKELKKLK